MIEKLKSFPLPWLRLLLTLLAIAVGIGIAAKQPTTLPNSDGQEYVSYARSLYLAGSYASTPAGPQTDVLPGREPLYSALIALTAHVVPSLADSLVNCSPLAESCGKGFKTLSYLNGLLLGLATGFTLLALGTLGGGRLAHLVTAGYLILNLHITKDLRQAESDFLAMACLALTVWLLVRACRTANAANWLAAGVGLAALALTKASFLPFAALLVGWLGLRGLWHLRRYGLKALAPAVAVGSILLAINGSWMARNIALFGVTSDSRGAIALSTREVFDHMTPQEHLAAWVWWTRGPGNGLAKQWFPPEVWTRHEWYDQNGFYLLGQVTHHSQRLAEVRVQHPDWPESKLLPLVTKMVSNEILADFPGYLETMPALIYRGLWCDEFIIVGFPLLILISIRALRRRDGAELAALLPGWWSLLFYAAVSLNIPRYQMTALTALALATGLYVQTRVEKKRLNAAAESS